MVRYLYKNVNVEIRFPYPDVQPLEVPDSFSVERFALPEVAAPAPAAELVRQALDRPIGTSRLRDLARGKKRVLVISDDVTRPTPVADFVAAVLDELTAAGVEDSQVRFIMALGTHRPMTRPEMEWKLGAEVVNRYQVFNHDWADPECLEHVGSTAYGDPVWVNRMVRESDLVIGLGAIMPIEICGFTGGGKILVPGLGGELTVDSMHWTRIGVSPREILGKPDNPIRASIDALARKAGLHFIVNVILNARNEVVAAVAGDMVQAHRAGCPVARNVYGVQVEREYDVVVADSYPFDIEFWQANKALDTAGQFVRRGGVVVLVCPCTDGISRPHGRDVLEIGYQPIETIKGLVEKGTIRHLVVGVHMAQVSAVAVEKARLILVTPGITPEDVRKMGFSWAATPQEAFQQAVQQAAEHLGGQPKVAVLEGAARMLVLRDKPD
ncbi:MAG: nickel-dependent lactate racemase [Spirochaetales bacterium]|nr:nickel-dependent lactate racemase [Spirochaetales bacterium]